MIHYHRGIYGLLTVVVMSGMQGCIDHDYDLSQDIDLTIEAGGELTLPSSSVAPYTMKKIMNLSDDGTGSIRPDGAMYGLAEGDYVLVQDGEGSNTVFSVPEVTLSNLSSPGANQTVKVDFNVPSGVSLPTFNIYIGGTPEAGGLNTRIDPIENTIHMSESNVNRDIVRLDKIGTEIDAVFKMWISLNNNRVNATIKRGFRVAFDEALSLEVASSNADCAFEGSVLVFNSDVNVNTLDLSLRIKGFDCSKLPSGQGLVNHNFTFDGKVSTSGRIEVAGVSVPSGNVSMNINTSFYINSAKISSVTGIVDPTITINNSSFAINDIPDFLSDGGTVLDISNPQVYLTVDNSSKVSVDVDVTLLSMSNSSGQLARVYVGGIRVRPGHNLICISREGRGNRSGITSNVTVSNLNDLISTIPDRVEVTDCHAKVVQEPVEFVLGRDYTFSTDNEVFAPLAFGSAMRFTYSEKEEGWDEDLEDYNFKRLNISAVTSNTIPLSMKPSARAIFKNDPNGDRSRNVRVNVSGGIEAGTLANPTESTFIVEIVSDVENLAGLDGVEYTFTAENPIPGAPLNQAQAVTITKLDLTISGGIIVDLND